MSPPVLSALLVASPGEISLLLLLFVVAVVVLFVIDDDDLPGPTLCRVPTR
jgi:hypothetical protein